MPGKATSNRDGPGEEAPPPAQGYLPYTRVQEHAPMRTHQVASLSCLVAERPQEFKTTAGGGMLVVWKRAKG